MTNEEKPVVLFVGDMDFNEDQDLYQKFSVEFPVFEIGETSPLSIAERLDAVYTADFIFFHSMYGTSQYTDMTLGMAIAVGKPIYTPQAGYFSDMIDNEIQTTDYDAFYQLIRDYSKGIEIGPGPT